MIVLYIILILIAIAVIVGFVLFQIDTNRMNRELAEFEQQKDQQKLRYPSSEDSQTREPVNDTNQ